MSLLHACGWKSLDCVLRFTCCLPLVAVGCRSTYPDDPWYSPRKGVELVFFVPRMMATYEPGGEKGPAKLSPPFVEDAARDAGGRISAPLNPLPWHLCNKWNLVRSVTATTDGKLVVLVLPGYEEQVKDRIINMTDRSGRPIGGITLEAQTLAAGDGRAASTAAVAVALRPDAEARVSDDLAEAVAVAEPPDA